jgi:hypothetical protein
MGQPLRITVEQQDYSFQILNNRPDKFTREIKIALSGETHTLIKDVNDWKLKETDAGMQDGLAKAIGHTISLRYRI